MIDALDVPGVGRVVLSVHAQQRMRERDIGARALAEAIGCDARKLAAVRMLSTGRAIGAAFGSLWLVLSVEAGEIHVVTVAHRRSEARAAG